MSVNNAALKGTAGQDFGTGGDYFTPGEHTVRVDEVTFFNSKESEGAVFLVKGTVVSSIGGSHTWTMNNGVPPVAVQVAATPAKPMRVGATCSWIQKTSNMQIFKPRVGNFCLAVKQAFLQEMGPHSDSRTAAIDSNWKTAEDRLRVRKFLDTGAKSPDVTLEDDAIDVIDLGLAPGLILKVSASEKGTKKLDKIIVNSAWKAMSQAEVDIAEAALKAGLSSPPVDDEE